MLFILARHRSLAKVKSIRGDGVQSRRKENPSAEESVQRYRSSVESSGQLTREVETSMLVIVFIRIVTTSAMLTYQTSHIARQKCQLRSWAFSCPLNWLYLLSTALLSTDDFGLGYN